MRIPGQCSRFDTLHQNTTDLLRLSDGNNADSRDRPGTAAAETIPVAKSATCHAFGLRSPPADAPTYSINPMGALGIF